MAKEPVRIRFKNLTGGGKSVYLDIYHDGKRRYEFLKMYLKPETDAASRQENKNVMKAVEVIKAKRIEGLYNNKAGISNASTSSKLLLKDWMKTFYERKRNHGQSDMYGKLIHQVSSKLMAYKGGGIEMKSVDKDFCIGFIEFLKSYRKKDGKPLSAATINVFYHILNSALSLAVEENLLTFNPCSKIPSDEKVRVPDSTRDFLTVEDVKKLIHTECSLHPVVKKAYLFCCFCGLRYSDVSKLTWGDIVEDNGIWKIILVMTKTRRAITVALSEEALRWLPNRGTAGKDDKVFTLPSRTRMTVSLRRWSQAAGVTKNVTFHTSRHTCATLMLTAGADIYTVSKLLGHTSIQTTQIYAKIIDKKMEAAVNKVGELFKH